MQQLTSSKPTRTRKKRINVVSLKMVRERSLPYETSVIRSPKDVVQLAREFIGDADREHCILIALDTKNQPTALHTVSIGSLSAAIVHPRECLKICILANAASFIMVHNHPSNRTEPSSEDIELTKRLRSASELIGIEMLDHLIITSDSHYSMKESGLM
jgi:DNA repair proteins